MQLNASSIAPLSPRWLTCITPGRYVGSQPHFCKAGLWSIQIFPVMPARHHRTTRGADVFALPSLAKNPAQQAECAEEDHSRGDDGEHQEGDEEGAASAAALLDEYLCRRLLRRWLSHSGGFLSIVDVTALLVVRRHLFGAQPHVAKSPA